MTDSEKLDLILAEMAEMKTEMKDINQKVDELKKKVDKLAVEQAGITKELYMINRKITDTYGVALDALASTAENRKWLETGSKSLI